MASSAAARYKELKKQVEDAKKEMKKTAKAVFTEASEAIFEKYPQLLSYRWTQYTPYWNDGDTCTFSAYVDDPVCEIKTEEGKVIKYSQYGDYLYEDDDVEFEVSEEEQQEFEKKYGKIGTEVAKFLQTFGDDDLEVMFGDHAAVTVKRTGKVSVEEYEHE